MKYKVYDFKDIKLLDRSLIADELRNSVIVTATADLAKELSAYYADYSVLDVHQIIHVLLQEWESTSRDFKNYISLRNSLEEYLFEYGIDEVLATSLRRNAYDMWNAIKLLIEADVYPDDIPDDISGQVRCFKEIWKITERNNDKVMKLRTKLAFSLSVAKNVREMMEDICKSEKLVMIGFYFITPIQQRLFEVLDNAGYQLIFLNCRNKDYPYSHAIWEKSFHEIYGDEKPLDVQEGMGKQNGFGDALENGIPYRERVLKAYDSEFEFARSLKESLDKGHLVYSPAAKECNKLLTELYPETDKERHFLSYPVGQYIYNLHMMWDDFDNKLVLKQEYVNKCFASGWLCADGKNGRSYTYSLKRVEPLFEGCRYFDKWKERIEEVKRAKSHVREYEVAVSDRYERILCNPYEMVGAYSISDAELDDICMLLSQLMSDAEMLFGGETRTNLFSHLQKIKDLIQLRANETEIEEDEKEVARELIERLDTIVDEDMECPLNSIKEAIVSLVGNRIDEYQGFDDEVTYSGDFVRPLAMVESCALADYGQPIHLVMADELTLPGKRRSLPWPLTDKVIERIRDSVSDRKNVLGYIERMIDVISFRPLSYRYLFYSFIGNRDCISNGDYHNRPELYIEWMKNNGDKKTAASPYVYVMGEILSDHLDRNADQLSVDVEYALNTDNQEENSVDERQITLPVGVEMERMLCPYRFIYGYVLNSHPEYNEEFHLYSYYQQLISLFGDNRSDKEFKTDKYNIAKQLEELFPFLNKAEAHQAADYAKKKAAKTIFNYKGHQCSDKDLSLYYLDDRLKEYVVRLYEDFLKGRRSNSDYSGKCMYCPYRHVCIEQFEER